MRLQRIVLLLIAALTAVSSTMAWAQKKTDKKKDAARAKDTYMICIAQAKPTHNTTYTTRVFQVRDALDRPHAYALSFRQHLAKEFGYPTMGTLTDTTCRSAANPRELEDYKKQRLQRLPNVVQTNWKPDTNS